MKKLLAFGIANQAIQKSLEWIYQRGKSRGGSAGSEKVEEVPHAWQPFGDYAHPPLLDPLPDPCEVDVTEIGHTTQPAGVSGSVASEAARTHTDEQGAAGDHK